jgi:hypothetical protein
MHPYWLLFLVPAFFALIGSSRKLNHLTNKYPTNIDFLWLSVIVVFTIIIGFRYHVGGDWGNYYWQVERSIGVPFLESFTLRGDPLFSLLNWISGNLGFGVYGVQVTAGLIFSYGLAKFCLTLPRPFLALTVAIPYLVIVVAMGYSRQGLAIGVSLIALIALMDQKKAKFIVLVLIASSIHKSAIILLPILGYVSQTNKIWTLIWVAFGSVIAFFVFVSAYIEFLIYAYFESEYNSSGAFIRLSMSMICATIFLLFSKKFNFDKNNTLIWKFFSYASLVLFFGLFLSSSSTALDRIALYFIPLQLVVLSYLPEIFSISKKFSQGLKWLIVFYCSMVLLIWLVFADSSYRWIPYKSFLFELVDYKDTKLL